MGGFSLATYFHDQVSYACNHIQHAYVPQLSEKNTFSFQQILIESKAKILAHMVDKECTDFIEQSTIDQYNDRHFSHTDLTPIPHDEINKSNYTSIDTSHLHSHYYICVVISSQSIVYELLYCASFVILVYFSNKFSMNCLILEYKAILIFELTLLFITRHIYRYIYIYNVVIPIVVF